MDVQHEPDIRVRLTLLATAERYGDADWLSVIVITAHGSHKEATVQKSSLASRIRKAGIGVALAATATVAISGTAQAASVYGETTNGCADAGGTYSYSWTGNAQGRDTYNAYFNITVRDKCPGDG